MERISDDLLVDQFLEGDIKAFEELVSRYTEKAFSLSLRITKNLEDAEEVVQDVFIKVYKKLHTFKKNSSFSSWFYRVTSNTALMKLRSKKKSLKLKSEDFIYSRTIVVKDSADKAWLDHDLTIKELRVELEEAINSLPSIYRTIFVMHDIDGLKNNEISSILDLGSSAVKSRLHRARNMLRKNMRKFYNNFKENEFSQRLKTA